MRAPLYAGLMLGLLLSACVGTDVGNPQEDAAATAPPGLDTGGGSSQSDTGFDSGVTPTDTGGGSSGDFGPSEDVGTSADTAPPEDGGAIEDSGTTEPDVAMDVAQDTDDVLEDGVDDTAEDGEGDILSDAVDEEAD